VLLVSLPGGRAVSGGGASGGGGAASVVTRGPPAYGRRGREGGAADFSSAPPAAFLIRANQPVRVRLSLYATTAAAAVRGGGGTPVLVGTGEVEEGDEASGSEGAWVGLTKAGARPPTPGTSPRGGAGATGQPERPRAPAVLRPRVRVRLLVGRPGDAAVAPPPPTTPPPPGSPEDWLAGGVLRVGLASPPPVPAPSRRSLAHLVEARAGGWAAWLGGEGGDHHHSPAADFALPASALAAGALTLSAWDWAWPTAADTPLSFTRPGVGRAGPAVASIPLARLAGAPGGRTTGVFGLGGGGGEAGGIGAPPGVWPAVAVDARWVPFMRR
jgi:hypothetical protein